MCGRFVQYSGIADFLEELGGPGEIASGYDNMPLDRYNVAPGTRVKLLRSSPQGMMIDYLNWGWAPHWATRMQKPINARVEKVAESKFYRQVWPHRCVIPANGWYEWVDEGGPRKQPYYIHLKNHHPMFFAAIGEFDGNEERNGFVIITADAEGGLLDVHDRRPIVLPPRSAREWLDQDTSTNRAAAILSEPASKAEDFVWYAVDRAVGNVRNQGARLIEAL